MISSGGYISPTMKVGAGHEPITDRPVAALFDPASVAVIGASDDQRKWGNWLARGALRGETRRPVYLINHRSAEILQRRAYLSLAELPERPDLVVIAVPMAALAESVDAALDAGARAIVAISAGQPSESAAADAQLAARVRGAGAVLLGPNSLGVLDSGQQLELVPNPLPPGSIGFISQSGNLALELGRLAAQEGLGFSRFASLGNQADLGATELVRELAGHAETRLIALYVEDFRDGRELVRAGAAAVTAGKPVLALAIERGAATTRAVASHTGALASHRAAIDAACRAAGIERVRTPRELLDVAQAMLRAHPARGRRVAVLSDGGGHASIAAAVAAQRGLELPELAPSTAARLRAQLPPGAAVSNPVDLAGGAERDVHAFDRTARLLLDGGEVDALLVTGYFGGYFEYGPEVAVQECDAAVLIGDAARRAQRPAIVHTMYPRGPAAAALRGTGVPVYETIEQAVGALARLALGRPPEPDGIPSLPEPADPVREDGYAATRALLAAGGVPFVAARNVTSAAEAIMAARELAYPVVLKALGRLHKSDAGGVVLGLTGDDQLRRAYSELQRRLAPGRCSIEAMAPVHEGVQLLVGTRWDERLGPVSLVGSGGIDAEVLHDTAVALAPVSPAKAEQMLLSLRVAPVLRGYRGRPALCVEGAAAVVAALSRVGAAHPELIELEVNPLLVTPTGALALDARAIGVTPSPQEPRESAIHLHP